jgi:hypothetical protein
VARVAATVESTIEPEQEAIPIAEPLEVAE